MTITAPLAQAARILVQWPVDHVAHLTGIDERALTSFETGGAHLNEVALLRLKHVLEEGGALFLPEDGEGGVGVRLKFTARDVRAINRLEGEGGLVGSDDI